MVQNYKISTVHIFGTIEKGGKKFVYIYSEKVRKFENKSSNYFYNT